MKKNNHIIYNYFGNRFLDLFISFFAIIVLFIPMSFLALLIKIESKGPIFYKSKRLGKNKELFTIYKFRSMKVDTPHDVPSIDLDSNKYLTKIGRIIRKTSLDELPQIFNVIFGQMSIVGPRPIVTTEQILIDLRDKYNVYSIKPGITGLAQINGRDLLSLDLSKKAIYDKQYLETKSFNTDLKIILKTFVYVIKARDVTH
jgi:O-antigen biosynthesis protein WbqP